MPPNVLLQFKERIHPFRPAFNQLCLSCAAVLIEGKWISLYTSLILSNSEDAGLFTSRIVKPGHDFTAVFAQYAVETFDTLASALENGRIEITVNGETYEIFMNRYAAGLKSDNVPTSNVHFAGIWRPPRDWASERHLYRPSFQLQASGDRLYQLISQDDSERISRELRADTPPYNSLEGLLQTMGNRNRVTSSEESQVEIKAIVPFDIVSQEESVVIECPHALAPGLSLLCFFSSHESVTLPYSEQLKSPAHLNRTTIQFLIPWPAAASKADAHIRFKGAEVERISIRHWATGANWRLTVDSHFDPGSRLLKRALRDNSDLKGEKRSEAFEQAIVRLLNLGNIPAIWHGALRQSGKPDLAAFCEIPGRRIALIGECTLEKPSAKLSTLRTRIIKFREQISDSTEIIPVVFTACEPIELDYSEASKAGVALIGAKEIARIESLIESNRGAAEIIKLIESTTMLHGFPVVARWEQRY